MEAMQWVVWFISLPLILLSFCFLFLATIFVSLTSKILRASKLDKMADTLLAAGIACWDMIGKP